MAFEIWPYMILAEGPVQIIGQLLLELYENAKIDRSRWIVDHRMDSRKSYAQHLLQGGTAIHRQGIGMRDELMLRIVQLGCARLNLNCHVFAKGA
ncbi:MAG TPA: hypothetical protein VKT72_08045 [Candidatus Baltobacteraceae bacterium]|nr:hypothetical protein [Candidatus Baltobacteraceae bacterium]